MPISVLTRGYDNARTGANTQETQLTAAAVSRRGIRRLFDPIQLPGDRRGTEAQLLIAAGVQLPGNQRRDLLIAATMSNDVFACDANTGHQVWHTNLGPSIQGTQGIDMHTVNDQWGVLSTPVIHNGVIYLCAWISADHSVAQARHQLFALRVTDGSRAQQHPVDFEDQTYDPGNGRNVQRFASLARKQRAALLFADNAVFVAFGSVKELDHNARGWIIAVDVTRWDVTATWTSTTQGFGGGIWQAGAGLVSDGQGNLVCMTGNGSFDGVSDFAQSILKLHYTAPAAGQAKGSLRVTDSWTPWSDEIRIGHQLAEQAPPLPTNFRAYSQADIEDWGDMDLGSGGPVLDLAQGFVLGAGKDGILYVTRAGNMGRTMPADFRNPLQNYNRLAAQPIWFTFFPGVNISAMPQEVVELNVHYFNKTHHLHGSPLLWDGPDHGKMLFCWGENGNLRAWTLHPDGRAEYLACSAEVASANVTDPNKRGGMPGGMMCLSANGRQPGTAVVWACIPYGDANTGDPDTTDFNHITWGRLLAYDATNFSTFPDGSKQLRVLWDSQQWNLSFPFCKFTPPVVANGKLYVPTYAARIDVYGLA
jgi:hypothetical protein